MIIFEVLNNSMKLELKSIHKLIIISLTWVGMCRCVNRHIILENNVHELKFVGKFLLLYFKDT